MKIIIAIQKIRRIMKNEFMEASLEDDSARNRQSFGISLKRHVIKKSLISVVKH